MKKDAVQKGFQDFFFLLFTFGSGLFYLCFYLISITLAFGLMVIFVGIPLLKMVLRTTHTFVQYERIQTKVFTDISIEPIVVGTRGLCSKRLGDSHTDRQPKALIRCFWLFLNGYRH